jgi:hypothetical protein
MNPTNRDKVHGALAVARALLVSNRPLGRLCLAALAHSAREHWRRERVSLDPYRRDERIAEVEEIALDFEAAQLAEGFEVSAQEIENAEVVVAPAAVERWPNRGHGSRMAALDEHASSHRGLGASFSVEARTGTTSEVAAHTPRARWRSVRTASA